MPRSDIATVFPSHISPSRRAWLGKAGAFTVTGVAASLGCHLALAADAPGDYPSKPVRIIVPVAAGGSADKLTRLIAEKLSVMWKQSVLVENVPGATGTIGAARTARSAADGYTLMQTSEGLTLAGLLLKDLPFDVEKSFTRIIKAVVNPQIPVVHPSTGILTLRDYVNRAREKPDSINVALAGNGTIAQVAHAILAQQTGIKVNYIPYSGGGPASLSTLSGQTDALVITLAAVTEQVRSGKLRALAVTTAYRSPALPDVPTVAEAAGLPDYAVESWQGFLAPAGTPKPVIDKINRDMESVLNMPDVRTKLDEMGYKVAGGSAAELVASIQKERTRYAQAIKAAGISLR